MTLPNFITPILAKVPLLTEENYSRWKDAMAMVILGAGAIWITDDDDATVPTTSVLLDKQMAAIIWSVISEELQYLVLGKTSGLDAWKAVKERFQRSTLARRFKCREDFHHIEHDPSKSIDIYIHAIETARQRLKDLGCTVDDTQTLDVLLMNLHPSYHTIRTSILTAQSEPSLSDVKGILIGSASSAIVIKSEPVDIAFAAGPKRGVSKKKSGQFSRSGTNPSSSPEDDKGFRWCDPTNEGHCHRCGRPGHIAARCIYDMPQVVKDWVMNPPHYPRFHPPSTDSNNRQQETVLSATLATQDYDIYGNSQPSSLPSQPTFLLQI
jgi:hypothetical protein